MVPLPRWRASMCNALTATAVRTRTHLPSVAGEPRLLQQLAKLPRLVHRLPRIAGLEGGRVHKLAATAAGAGGRSGQGRAGEGRAGQGEGAREEVRERKARVGAGEIVQPGSPIVQPGSPAQGTPRPATTHHAHSREGSCLAGQRLYEHADGHAGGEGVGVDQQVGPAPGGRAKEGRAGQGRGAGEVRRPRG